MQIYVSFDFHPVFVKTDENKLVTPIPEQFST